MLYEIKKCSETVCEEFDVKLTVNNVCEEFDVNKPILFCKK